MNELFSIDWKGELFKKLGYTFEELAGGDAARIISMGMNKVCRKAYTGLKRDLKATTAIAYDTIQQSVKAKSARRGHLVYTIQTDSHATNLRQFHPYSGPRGFTADPWGVRHGFPRTFQPGPPGSNPQGIVYHRLSVGREIRPSFGPNLAVEMLRRKPLLDFEQQLTNLLPEVMRLLDLKIKALGPFAIREEGD